MAEGSSFALTPYERVFLGIAIIVTLIWAVATVVQIAYPNRVVPEYANLVMMTVAGSFFGGAVLTSRANRRAGDSNGDDPYDGPGGYYRHGR